MLKNISLELIIGHVSNTNDTWESYYALLPRRSSISGKLIWFDKLYNNYICFTDQHNEVVLDYIHISEEEYIMYSLQVGSKC